MERIELIASPNPLPIDYKATKLDSKTFALYGKTIRGIDQQIPITIPAELLEIPNGIIIAQLRDVEVLLGEHRVVQQKWHWIVTYPSD